MSTPSSRRPLPNTTGQSPSPRRTPHDSSPGIPVSGNIVPPSGIGQGLARNPSLRRPARRSAARMSTSLADSDLEQEEDERIVNNQLIAELKESLQRVEQANEQYRKQLDAMKGRLDDATNQLTVAEEKEFQRQTELDHLRAASKDTARQRRELEMGHESETRLLMQGQQALIVRENEMQNTIARLNEILRSKGLEKAIANRAASTPAPASPNDDSYPSSGADNEMHLAVVREKDAMIESLRLELAEVEFNAAEQGHVGEGRFQELEKQVVDLKLHNARLTDENETFQMLLSEKTLKGDFVPDSQDTVGLNTLAEELESFSDDPEAQNEAYKKLEAENKQLKESSKALTLYIDKIIGRILQHEGFEHIIIDKDDKDTPPPPPAKAATFSSHEKALPPPPPGQDNAGTTGVQNAAAGFLQRARSVVSRTGPGKPARPMSYAQPNIPPTANENPETAPSIPLNRGHRRARSDQAQQDLGAAAVVQQMNRGSPLRTVSGGPMSPGISPLSPQLSGKPGYFPSLSQASTRAPSGSQQGGGRGSSRNSVNSEHSQEHSSTDASSAQMPPTTNQSNGPNIPGAVMKQNQLRPLRLVQAQSREDEEAQKRANRGSWMGWLRGSTLEAQNDETMR